MRADRKSRVGGVIGAISIQFPWKMVALGLEAVVKFLRCGKRPRNSPSLDFFYTSTTLVTDQLMRDIPLIGLAPDLNNAGAKTGSAGLPRPKTGFHRPLAPYADPAIDCTSFDGT